MLCLTCLFRRFIIWNRLVLWGMGGLGEVWGSDAHRQSKPHSDPRQKEVRKSATAGSESRKLHLLGLDFLAVASGGFDKHAFFLAEPTTNWKPNLNTTPKSLKEMTPFRITSKLCPALWFAMAPIKKSMMMSKTQWFKHWIMKLQHQLQKQKCHEEILTEVTTKNTGWKLFQKVLSTKSINTHNLPWLWKDNIKQIQPFKT